MNRRGWQTTEFYVTIAIDVGVFTAALADALPPRYAAIAASVSTGAYAIARGIAKIVIPPV